MKKTHLVFLAAVACVLVPTLAHAVTTITTTCSASGSLLTGGLAAPCSTDWWRQSLEMIFPGVGPLGGGDTQAFQGVRTAMRGFLVVLMAVATSMMAWHFISGTVATAHEGVILGHRWHQVWAPLRLCYGIGMLAPTAKGFCLAQVLVIYVALCGGSLGNVVWTSYVTGLVTPNLTSAPALPATGALVKDFTEAELCRQSILAEPGMVGWPSDVPTQMPQEHVGASTGENLSVSFGNLMNRFDSVFSGGSIKSSAQSNRESVTWDYGVCGQISGSFAVGSGGDSTVTTFDKARLAAIERARNTIAMGVYHSLDYTVNPGHYAGQTLAQMHAESSQIFTDAVNSAKTTMDTEFQAAAQTLVDVQGGSNSAVASLVNDSNKYGWMTAGMLYMSASRLQSAAYSLASDVPQVTIPPMAETDKSGHIDVDSWGGARRFMQPDEDLLTGLTMKWNQSDDTADLRNAALAGSTDGNTASLHGVEKWLFSKVFSLGDKYLVGLDASGANGSPIQQLSAFGNELLNLVGGLIFGGLGIAAIFGGPAGVAAVAGIFSSGPLSWLGIVMLMLIGVGIEHAYLVPMAPFIEFTVAALGILVATCEAFVVLPLWALMHVRLDGSEFINEQQKSGYLLLLSLFLRIPLTVFGLIFSMQVLNAGVGIVSRSFSVAALSGTADSGGGIIGALVMLILEGWMFWKVTTLSTRVITSMPELAGKLIGWATENLRIDSPSHTIGGIVSKTTGAAGHDVAKIGGKGGKTPDAGGQGAGKAGGGMATTERAVSS
ncbi:DotA/TraY family protein [Nguyenibacter sp. L1]|uniref:DotA/TraY family protein n=1 Tax=Nguyenibacter sp. L1 TaxID=3049350 RepID=UPI002B488488|nr:DotA/TraY family protein [Nguyenibacter sp. L1]WRH89570.1 DotA/TraY family protein [Nguyenibacter sp. L1]